MNDKNKKYPTREMLIADKHVSALFESFFKIIPEAAVLTDKNCKMLMFNPALIKIFGYVEEELIGKHKKILYASQESANEKVAAPSNFNDESILKVYQVNYRRKNGKIFPGKTTTSIIKDGEGKILGYLSIIRDILDAKANEIAIHRAYIEMEKNVEIRTRELRTEKERVQQYLDIAGVIIVVLDTNGNVRLINRKGTQIFGYKEEKIEGKNWFDNFIPERERKEVKEAFAKIISGNIEPLEYYENRILTKNGDERIIAWHNTVIRDENNNIISSLSSGEDITEKRQVQNDLRESSESIKRFAYSISHDLKNPTLALQGLTKHLEKKYGETLDKKGKLFFKQIQNTAEHIAVLVDNLNTFIITKEIPFEFEHIDLKELCGLIRDEFSDQLQKRGASWIEPEELPIIKADRISIMRVLRNFVDNALKYGGNKLNAIKINCEHSGTSYILSVKDNGLGFDEDKKEYMFKVFSRNMSSGDVYGTGLGLAIVKEIAEKHGGKAWAESNTNQGATFYISIAENLN